MQKVRIKAIYYAIKFGLLPYWLYEAERHYECSYFQHLCVNLNYAWRWITFHENISDLDFEKETNGNCLA
jgi:hypothetical protein